MHLNRQHISLFPDKRSQVKLRRRKAVLCIPHKLSVQPYIYRLLYPFKTDPHALSDKSLVQIKHLPVRTDRIVCTFTEHPGTVSGIFHAIRCPAVFLPFPRIHRIDITDLIIACQLDVPRHHDRIKAAIIISFLIKVLRTALYISAVTECPLAV